MSKHPSSAFERAVTLTKEAVAKSDDGDYEGAETLLREAVELAPEHDDFLKNYTAFCLEVAHEYHCVTEDYPAAVRFYQKVLTFTPDDGETWMDLGSAHASSDEALEALHAWRNALELFSPKVPHERENIERILENLRLIQKGIAE